MNRRLNVLLALGLILIGAAVVTYVRRGRRAGQESVALRLQEELLSPDKKPAEPWPEQDTEPAPEAPAAEGLSEEPPGQTDPSREESGELTGKLELALRALSSLKETDFEPLVQAADELLRRNPDDYNAYKAKLLLLLTGEARFLAEPDEAEVERILAEMAQFEGPDTLLEKEAFNAARLNTRMAALESDIDDLDADLEDVEASLEDEGLSAEERQALTDERDALIRDADESEMELARIEEDAASGIPPAEDVWNRDLLKIPFQRWLARGEYERAVEEADVLIDEFPESTLGYVFLIRALELSGRGDEALDVILGSDLDEGALDAIEERLDRERAHAPEDYWKRLRF